MPDRDLLPFRWTDEEPSDAAAAPAVRVPAPRRARRALFPGDEPADLRAAADLPRRSGLPGVPQVRRADGGRPRRASRTAVPESGRRRTLAVVLAVLAGLLASGLLVWQGTSAVFSSTTADGPNSFALGAVTLGDDDTGSALFTASGLLPGGSGSNCIAVTYSGNVATSITLYASASSDASSIAQYVNLTIEQGTGGGYGSCGSFVPGSTIYTGTLASFTATKTDYGSGVGSWTPNATATKVYKISYDVDVATPSGKQGTSTTATFQWESQA